MKKNQKSTAFLSLGIFILSGCLSFGNTRYKPRCDIFNFNCVDRVALQEPNTDMKVLGAIIAPSTISKKLGEKISKAVVTFLSKITRSRARTSVVRRVLTDEEARQLVNEIRPFISRLGQEVTELEERAALAAWRELQEATVEQGEIIIRNNTTAIEQLRKYLDTNAVPNPETIRRIQEGLDQLSASRQTAFQHMNRAYSDPQNTAQTFRDMIERMWGSYTELESVARQVLEKFSSSN